MKRIISLAAIVMSATLFLQGCVVVDDGYGAYVAPIGPGPHDGHGPRPHGGPGFHGGPGPHGGHGGPGFHGGPGRR